VETSPDIPTKIRTPPKKTREKFLLTHELKGAQEAVNLLTRYYGIRTMKIVLDGHRVGCGDEACYYQNKAYFTKRGLNKRNVLHELYHHLVYVNDLDTTKTKEEKAANSFARDFLS
jgi:hypothetical protein